MTLDQYINNINKRYKLGNATEHTFRGMQWHLLKTYDKMYIIDLHGNAKKKKLLPMEVLTKMYLTLCKT